MDVFELRDTLVTDYKEYVESFVQISDERIREYVEESLQAGVLWPEPLIQLNPSFEPGDWIDGLVDAKVLREECRKIFRKDKDDPEAQGLGRPLRLHRHQTEAITAAKSGDNYVLTTGTGSGKSLAYMVPIVDYVLGQGSGKGIKAIVVYPMNALANSQREELTKFLCIGYPDGKPPVTFARYTGQETEEDREAIKQKPPDILLTNYVMLELILTRTDDSLLINAAQGLRFLVLDELHTYRGRQGADVALLVRRVRDRLDAHAMQCVGTSATLAGAGTSEQQQAEVADVASRVFGAKVRPENVIVETVQRTTPERDVEDAAFRAALRTRLTAGITHAPADFESFVTDPLASWIESTFGVTSEAGSGRLTRSTPRSMTGERGAAKALSDITGVDVDTCVQAVQDTLLAGYRFPHPETGFPAFAFRLHQFISKGDTVYAALEDEGSRYITLEGQQFVPGSRDRVLLPLVFCRECGQEYYCVRSRTDGGTGQQVFEPRDLSDRASDGTTENGFIYFNTEKAWPQDQDGLIQRLPDDWLEERDGELRIRQGYAGNLPRLLSLSTSAPESKEGLKAHFFKAPFRFCLTCGVSYGARDRDDYGKLATLASEGRSTATTILSISTVRSLEKEGSLPKHARKLLSFTDNRQDASLQAGHFNDFVEVCILRSALYRAAEQAGDSGLRYDELTQKVFDALALPKDRYAADPDLRYGAEETNRALRNVLGYRLYRDLKRGWRITLPNLEQCGLLEIRYPDLEPLCRDEEVWQESHGALVEASPQTRARVAKTLLDYLRRELALKVDFLNPQYQESIYQQSNQRLVSPWAIDESEGHKMEHASTAFPRARRRDEYRDDVYISPAGGFGLYLRRASTFPEHRERLTAADTAAIVSQLFEALRVGGLVERVREPDGEDEVPGYQVPASAMVWVPGDGSRAFHDLIRVPNQPEDGRRTNPFFVGFYRTVAAELEGLEAREHTAQVSSEERIKREQRFGDAELPVLFCSPTMELGIDIKLLNVVNMRNVPPTPANYAQRSGRAGRSGQPALVFTYCTRGSSHDQYFFKRPELMVHGAVAPPRLDLGNEDLVRAHVHAVWLSGASVSLGRSLTEVMDLSGEDPSLAVLPSIADALRSDGIKLRARDRCRAILGTMADELADAPWHSEGWLDEVLAQIALSFDDACDRWRGLYRSARRQIELQNKIMLDHTRSADDREQAKRLRQEAESQLDLLTRVDKIAQSDFYSYRYFASEGFLPGYNFPRLPLSAYIPARRAKGKDEYLSRPRFLAISEFGPRAIVYHEGSRYVINKVILPVREAGDQRDTALSKAKLCGQCGYLHPIGNDENYDKCEYCDTLLGQSLGNLFRLQNVSTRRRDRISSDEEERMRFGFDIVSGARFAGDGGQRSDRIASVELDGAEIARLTYGDRATIWRINLGWRRRQNPDRLGFVLDMERGYWAKNEQMEDDPDDPASSRQSRVIPYVEDHRNCLLFEAAEALTQVQMASLQAALKHAIQTVYQLEENELAVEPLPDKDKRRIVMLYEAAEGGAGVLRRLVDDPEALSRVARAALDICHFDPNTGEDLRRAPLAREDCEAACYNCLMTYGNQLDHKLLDRQAIKEFLIALSAALVRTSPTAIPRAEHLRRLKATAGSDLERDWLDYLEDSGYSLPAKAQALIEKCSTRPDFLYDDHQAAIYVDGPAHEYPERQQRDVAQAECLEDAGYTVIRFGYRDDWGSIIARHPNIFGRSS